MNYKKYFVIGCRLICYIMLLKYMFALLFPFLLAILCFFILKPLIDRVQHKIPLQTSAIGISLLLMIYLFFAFLLAIGFMALFSFAIKFFQMLPVYYDSVFLPFMNQLTGSFQQVFLFLPQDIIVIFQNWIHQNIFQAISFASQFIQSIPSFLFSFFIFMISTFFFMLDYEDMKSCFLRFISHQTYIKLVQLKNHVLQSLWIYIKCQFTLMFVTFMILWIAFMILDIEPALPYAFAISLLDGLPFIGVGIILIPMMLLYAFQGICMKSLYLFCLYILINMIHQFLEPHIMNKETKIPAFLLLVSMVVHIHFFGIVGIVLSPLHMSFLYQYFHQSQDLV